MKKECGSGNGREMPELAPHSAMKKGRRFFFTEVYKGLLKAVLEKLRFGQLVVNAVLSFVGGHLHLAQREGGQAVPAHAGAHDGHAVFLWPDGHGFIPPSWPTAA